ncbi:MAG: HDOD domain-containing protein [Myxococcota bacterium]
MRVERLLRGMRSLPTLPDVALDVVTQLEDPDFDLRRVAVRLERDGVLAARLVGMANSAFYGGCSEIVSVREAIVRLGARASRSTILSVAIMGSVPRLPEPLSARRFWVFGLGSAICARQIAPDLGYGDADRAYLGALVHRLGDAFLAMAEKNRYAAAWHASQRSGAALALSLEKEFGIAPTALAARVLREWGLPGELADAVEHCHAPDETDEAPELALLIWIAGRVARELGLGFDPVASRESPAPLRRELELLGYDGLVRYLESQEDFTAQVRRLGDQFAPASSPRPGRPLNA